MTEEQPKPVPNQNVATWGLVIARATAERKRLCDAADHLLPDEARDRLIRRMAERDALGLERYGVRLQPHNGRDSLRDLQEELLDGAVYAMNAYLESGSSEATRSVILLGISDEQRFAALRVERLIMAREREHGG